MNANAPFRPSWLLRSSHLQSIAAALPVFAPPSGFAPASREDAHVPLPADHALLARAWWHAVDDGPRDALLLVHGVAGSSESNYVLRAAVAAYDAGLHVVRLNLRGAGEGAPLASTFYHGGLSEDVTAAVTWLLTRPEVARVHVLGFSLGGSVVLLAASEWDRTAPARLGGVAAVSAPLDLAAASRWNERTLATPYRRYLLRQLARMVLGQARRFPDHVRVDEALVRRARTVWEFDHTVVAPHHGFDSAAHYYARASPGPRLGRITRPTLVVHSDDDPLVPTSAVRPFLKEAGPGVQAVRTTRGGHVSFVSNLGRQGLIRTWVMDQVLSFLAQQPSADQPDAPSLTVPPGE